MAQIQYIKHLYENEEKSLREISRITGLSQQTVTKYAYMSDWNENDVSESSTVQEQVAEREIKNEFNEPKYPIGFGRDD